MNLSPLAFVVVVCLAAVVAVGAQLSDASTDDVYIDQRLAMVDTQIRARGVTDAAVLLAMENVPRHEFVPAEYQASAYADSPLAIGYEQTISQPYIVALMTSLIAPTVDDRVLEIGTGSGYQAAILAEIVGHVYTIEIVEPLGRDAAKLLERFGYDNVDVRIGDGYQGWPEEAPFDAIVVTAAPDTIPQPLIDQLAEGGRMVIPVGSRYQELLLLEKRRGQIVESKIANVRFVPMVSDDEE